MRQHLFDLVLFSTYAELRAERARSYLGLIWWVAEPAMMMAAFWLVFEVIFKTGGPDYIAFLLIGLTVWQWMKSCITHAGYSIWTNLAMVRQANLPILMFPLVQILADTVKFFFIFALLLVILWATGYPPNKAYLALVPLFVCILLASAGTGFVLAAIVPLVPDLRFVIEQVLTVVMFMSGVVFSLGDVPPPLSTIMAYNPVMVVMDDTRDILMYGLWPNWVGLWKVAVISIGVLIVGIVIVRRLAPRYPKLAA